MGALTASPRVLLAIALLALPPSLIAVFQLGRMHPDEVFQLLQPAHHFAFGTGELTWEWHKGLRNWLVPGTFGLFLKAAAALGIDDPQARRAVLALPQYALHALSLVALYRLIRRRLDPTLAHPDAWALSGVALIALYAPVLHFAGRTLSESISAPLLLHALERADDEGTDHPLSRSVLAGFSIGLAVIARYGSIVFALAAPLYLLATGRRRAALQLLLGGALAACVLAVLDWRTVGVPLKSMASYFEFNVFSGKGGKAFGDKPWWFLWSWAARALPLWAWAALALAGYRAIRARSLAAPRVPGLLLAPALLYLVAISIPALKEERFLYPALVLVLAALAPCFIRELSALSRPLAASLLALSLASTLALLAFQTRFSPRGTEQFRMFVRGVQTGHGVVLTHSGQWGAPGDFYAAGHPWVLCAKATDGCTRRALRDKRFDRIVTYKDDGARELPKRGFRVLERDGSFRLWGKS